MVLAYGYGYEYGYGSSFILLIPFLLLVFWAQSNVRNTFTKYTKVNNQRMMTGYEAAQRIIVDNNLDVQIVRIAQPMADHYDPRNKTLALSPDVYDGTSITAVAVAAHEVGHAIQDDRDYAFLRFRNMFAPIASFSSSIAPLIFIFSIISNIPSLITFSLILFGAAVLFQVVTLPVEIDASRRAINQLSEVGIIGTNEITPSKKVLKAAALTYITTTLYSIMNLVRLFLLTGNRRN